jgi:hypothetical protein
MDLEAIIRDAAARHGVDPAYLIRAAQIESTMNPRAANKHSSAKGLFQFIDSTRKQYGNFDPYDPVASSDAAARLAKDNSAHLQRAIGRAPTPSEMYLAHQQGAGGAAKLLTNPNAPAAQLVGNDAVALNAGRGGAQTAADFAAHWAKKFDGAPTGAPAAPQGAAPIAPEAPQGVPDAALMLGQPDPFAAPLQALKPAKDPSKDKSLNRTLDLRALFETLGSNPGLAPV